MIFSDGEYHDVQDKITELLFLWITSDKQSPEIEALQDRISRLIRETAQYEDDANETFSN